MFRKWTKNQYIVCFKPYDQPEDRLTFSDATKRCNAEVEGLKFMGETNVKWKGLAPAEVYHINKFLRKSNDSMKSCNIQKFPISAYIKSTALFWTQAVFKPALDPPIFVTSWIKTKLHNAFMGFADQIGEPSLPYCEFTTLTMDGTVTHDERLCSENVNLFCKHHLTGGKYS